MSDKKAQPERINVKTVEQISSGGAVFRRQNNEFEFAIIRVEDTNRWQLPKGLIDAGETSEQAARREVHEETGINAEILEKIETIEYWYYTKNRSEKVRFHKFVDFYLMKYLDGDIADHDHEVAEVRWVSADEAAKMLAFDAERRITEKALNLLETKTFNPQSITNN